MMKYIKWGGNYKLNLKEDIELPLRGCGIDKDGNFVESPYPFDPTIDAEMDKFIEDHGCDWQIDGGDLVIWYGDVWVCKLQEGDCVTSIDGKIFMSNGKYVEDKQHDSI